MALGRTVSFGRKATFSPLTVCAGPSAAQDWIRPTSIWPVGGDLQAVGLQLREERLALRDAPQVVHHAGDARIGRAGDGRVVHADLAVERAAQQRLPTARRALQRLAVVN